MNEEHTRDHLEIVQLGHRFADAANRRDYDAFVALWTPDGVWHVGAPLNVRFPASEMRRAIEQMLAQWDYFFQMPHAPVVEIHGDRATSRWTVQELARPKGKASGHANVSMYFDRLERRDGRWRYAFRDYNFLYVDESPLNGTPHPFVDRSKADAAWRVGEPLVLRERLLAQLSDAELARVSAAETRPLVEGDRYIDLVAPREGVKQVHDATVPSANLVVESAVSSETWARLLHTLGTERSS
jgi:ketosteroid isomerase-like protein